MLACIFRALPITTLSKYTIIFLYTYKKIPEIVQMLSLSTRDVSRRDYDSKYQELKFREECIISIAPNERRLVWN